MKNKWLLIMGIGMMLFFAACKKSGKTGLLIPNDASLAVHLDLSSLSSKLSWDEVKKTNWFAEAVTKSNDSLVKKLLNDPELSGIDTKSSLVFFMKRSGSGAYAAFEGKIKDAAKFSQIIVAAGKGSVKIEKDGDYSYAKVGADEAVVYFNDKMFVCIANASQIQRPGNNNASQMLPQKYAIDSLKIFAKNTFQLKGSDLLDSDKRFESLITDKADVHYWMNSGQLYGGMLPGMLGMLKLSALLEGNISTGKLDFDNGKISIDQKNYYGKELTDLFKKHAGKEVNSELIGHLPDGDVLAAMAFNYSPEGLKDLLKLLGVDGVANAALGQLGITADDFIKANKGDLAFAITGIEANSSPASVTMDNGEVIPYQKDNTKVDFVFGTSVNDKASYQKLIDVIGTQLKNKFGASTDSIDNHFKKKLENNWFALGSTDAAVNTFLAGGKKPAYAEPFTGHNGGGYINLQKIITTMKATNKDTADNKIFDLSAAFWKTATMHWDIKGGEAVSKVDVNLVDGNTNSLKQLNHYFDQLYLAKPKYDIKDDAVYSPLADSTIALDTILNTKP